MNVVSEMTALAITRPRQDASAQVRADWYAAKSLLHEYLAREGGPDSVKAHALAASAWTRSLQLRG